MRLWFVPARYGRNPDPAYWVTAERVTRTSVWVKLSPRRARLARFDLAKLRAGVGDYAGYGMRGGSGLRRGYAYLDPDQQAPAEAARAVRDAEREAEAERKRAVANAEWDAERDARREAEDERLEALRSIAAKTAGTLSNYESDALARTIAELEAEEAEKRRCGK